MKSKGFRFKAQIRSVAIIGAEYDNNEKCNAYSVEIVMVQDLMSPDVAHELLFNSHMATVEVEVPPQWFPDRDEKGEFVFKGEEE